MCGIAGIFHYGEADRTVDRRLLERMLRAIAHRGPDGEGVHVDGPVGLGHRRLSIVDLSETGRQPMASDDGALWTTYNGEFYNHGEHRARLAAARPFRGTSDTETLLRLFEERGARGFDDIAGIFGVAFWDARRRVLTLARDPLGVKQVYYHDDGRRIVFASEIKALLQCDDVPRELDEEGVNQYLHFHTPLFDRTSFRGIRQLRPGEYLEVSARGVERRIYFTVDDFEHRGSAEDQVAELRDLLGRVVRDQLMADVPLGAFLSGGVDSSAIASFIRRASVGALPCFGVHFNDQGVVDERPYQEAVAKALGVELELITLDGSTFPEDLLRAMYYQDEPVIGAAMLPMYHVSRLAAGRVKVCMGGQGADEVFGGYARYALASPLRVARSWLLDRGGVPLRADSGPPPAASRASVGGNLLHQLADPKTLRRLARGATHAGDWRELYFENFAKVSEREWARVIAAPEIVSRRACREVFYAELARSRAHDPSDRAMYWDVQTYLPGLFHQDDRMSMAHGLESRVPFADPRLVKFAFRLDPALKIRGGATKWALRQAIADVLPPWVLNRRKIGFDTPAERWMKQRHAGFVRDLLLSSRARHRGLWDPRGVEALLDHPDQQGWFDVVWKVLAIEVWAQIFLDAPPARADERARVAELAGAWSPAPREPAPAPLASTPTLASTPAPSGPLAGVGDALQEIRELGPRGTAFRVRWELSTRTGLVQLVERGLPPAADLALSTRDLPFGDGRDVAAALEGRVPEPNLARLRRVAEEATRGRILCFSRWIGDYGDPIDWHKNPVNGRRWSADRHWSRSLSQAAWVGDIKLTWEIGRFPQAYSMARAAALTPLVIGGPLGQDPCERGRMGEALASQIERFLASNPRGRGVHWISGQELAFRMMAWLFGLSVLGAEPPLARAAPTISVALREAAAHIEQHLDYARLAVYNNHLLSEAFGLLLAGRTLPGAPEAERWRRLGAELLEEQAGAQVYEDGAYIQNSHTYHRVAMHIYLWASALERRAAGAVPRAWTAAMERSLDFLYAQQNPGDGRLPNFGANDGALPSILSTCDYTDFRPLLQALSVVTRGERLYEPGPWDETTAWIAGPAALAAPLRPRARRSASFGPSGYHVLRGRGPTSFAAFRCGTLRDRFSQIDMLGVDVWWRGHNVLVDGGSYLYNGPRRWHELFIGTSGHNTVRLDGRDQMLHYRRFKNIYGIHAELLAFSDRPAHALVEGEHHGYARHPGGCVHRRAVLFVKDDLWIVVDRIVGEGTHAARLHWLGGPFPSGYDPAAGALTLETPAGPFTITALDEAGAPLAGDVVVGGQDPPRGWMSRYYGEKVPVPSLVVERAARLPLTLLSVLGPGRPEVRVEGSRHEVACGAARVRFQLDDGRISAVEVDGATPAEEDTVTSP